MHTTLSGKEPGLVGYWQFDDVGKIPVDSSPNHSDGKLMGDAHFIEVELPKPDELVIPAVISGIITNEDGEPIRYANVCLEQDGEKITQTLAGAKGKYRLAIFEKMHGSYDLFATREDLNLGDLRLGIRLHEDEHQTLNLTLKEAISIEGKLLMLDDTTPHVTVSVQAIRNGEVSATTLSDENGKYKFINLKPGQYQVRCYIPGGYVYYGQEGKGENLKDGKPKKQKAGGTLQVKHGKTVKY